jgi:hypothetical protein
LPPDLHQQAKQLTFELALRASTTGDPRDAFLGVDHLPLLSIGGWLLNDLSSTSSEPDGPGEDLERGLFMASFLGAMRAQAIDSIADPSSFFDHRFAAIARWCGDQALVELRRLIPAADGFRVVDQSMTGLWSSTAVSSAMAAAHLARADREQIEVITELVADMCSAFQIWDELSSLGRDLGQGRLTFPIAEIARAAGIPLEPMPDQLQILGAMVLTNGLKNVLDIASSHLDASSERARALNLPTLSGFLDDVAAADADRRARLVGGSGHVDVGTSTDASFGLEPSTREKAISMAEAFLLSDLTFRESWETHREGMLGANEVSAHFPAGLILEILCRTGHPLREPVDEFIAHAQNTDFRYYDHPASDPDSDTVGAVLRLLRYAGEWTRPSAGLESMLGCIDRLLEERGEIPVWLGDCAEPNAERPPTLTLGGRCGTVAAHLLLGLTELGDEYAPLVMKGASALFDRLANVGLGANVNYPPRYAVAIYFRLLQRTGSRTSDHPALRVLADELEKRSDEPILSAQEAALAVLAARAAHRPDVIKPAWKTTILKEQRFDGSWIGEPFAVAPNRGWHVSAYSSTTLTSALCYDALAGTDEGEPAEA